MGIVSTTAPVRFEPEGQEAAQPADRVAYLIRVPDVYGRAAYRRQVKARGARLYLPGDMRQAMRDDVEAARDNGAFSKDQARAAASTIDAFEAAVEDFEDPDATTMDEDLMSAFMEFENSVRGLGGVYAKRLAENEYFLEISMIEAVRMFVTGWENVGADLMRSEPHGLSEKSLGLIPDDHLWQLDIQVAELMSPSRQAEKNSASPSPGPSGRGTSTAAKASPRKTRPKTRKKSGPSRK